MNGRGLTTEGNAGVTTASTADNAGGTTNDKAGVTTKDAKGAKGGGARRGRYKSLPGQGKNVTGSAGSTRKIVRRAARRGNLMRLAKIVGLACETWLRSRGIYYDTFSGQHRERGLARMNGGEG